jgi:quercetin dioxygenase-like cupin family protein
MGERQTCLGPTARGQTWFDGSGTFQCSFDRRRTLLKGGVGQVERNVHHAVFGETHEDTTRGSVGLPLGSDGRH